MKAYESVRDSSCRPRLCSSRYLHEVGGKDDLYGFLSEFKAVGWLRLYGEILIG